MTRIEIKHRWTNRVIFAHEQDGNTMAITLKLAIAARSNLRGSDLTPIRDDIWAVLSAAPREVVGLIEALKNGKVDGSTYQGSCACLVGTIANVRGANYEALGALKPNSARPAERFFIAIRNGDTPATNQFSALAVEWVEQWLDLQRNAFDPSYTRPIVMPQIAADADSLN